MRGAVFATLALAGAAACGPHSVAISVTLITSGCAGADGGSALDGAGQLDFDILSSPDGGAFQTVNSLTTGAGAGSVQLPPLPLGTDRIRVRALSDATPQAKVLAEGDTGPFRVPGDGSVGSLNLGVLLRRTDTSVFTDGTTNPHQCTEMTTPRAYHGQALLANGKVLIYGGLQYPDGGPGSVDWTIALAIPPMVVPNTTYLNSAEIYDPATGQFTAAGSWTDDSLQGGPPAYRAFSQMLPYGNGAALVLGGDFSTEINKSLFVVPGWGDGVYSNGSGGATWTGAASPPQDEHARGCLVQDVAGHALLSGGYAASAPDTDNPGSSSYLTTTPSAEYFDPAAWPPQSLSAGEIPDGGDPWGSGTDRAEQACAGLSGAMGFTGDLVIEAGGTVIDPTGQYASILGDFFFYQFTKNEAEQPDFMPYYNGGSLIAGILDYPRARAKAVAMTVNETVDGGTRLQDAILVTGGFSCNPSEPGLTDCTPALAGPDGGTGPLANPPYQYFTVSDGDGGTIDVGQTTELIHFPGNEVTTPPTPGPQMMDPRIDHCVVALPDGRALLIGGLGDASAEGGSQFQSLSSIEVAYDDPDGGVLPDGGIFHPNVQIHETLPGLQTSRAGMACTLLPDGTILITGGVHTRPDGTVETLQSAEIYVPQPISVASWY